MTRLQLILLTAALLRFQSFSFAKAEPINISTITAGEADGGEVMKLFRQKVGDHANLLKLVSIADASQSLIFQADCMPRRAQGDAFACFYTLHYAGGTSKTFMGGGINVTKSADDMADGFLASVAQDVVENMNNSMRTNAVERLEGCLFLTQSSCDVPDVLVSELKVKTLNLSQYLQKGGLDKIKPGPAAGGRKDAIVRPLQ